VIHVGQCAEAFVFEPHAEPEPKLPRLSRPVAQRFTMTPPAPAESAWMSLQLPHIQSHGTVCFQTTAGVANSTISCPPLLRSREFEPRGQGASQEASRPAGFRARVEPEPVPLRGRRTAPRRSPPHPQNGDRGRRRRRGGGNPEWTNVRAPREIKRAAPRLLRFQPFSVAGAATYRVVAQKTWELAQGQGALPWEGLPFSEWPPRGLRRSALPQRSARREREGRTHYVSRRRSQREPEQSGTGWKAFS
jgi:hypothetical protein